MNPVFLKFFILQEHLLSLLFQLFSLKFKQPLLHFGLRWWLLLVLQRGRAEGQFLREASSRLLVELLLYSLVCLELHLLVLLLLRYHVRLRRRSLFVR